jgi:hypothetical protein
MNTIRLFATLALHALLSWNARQSAQAQRKFAAQLEEDMHAARRGIPLCDALAIDYDAKVREIRSELLARKLARLFQ